jgi:hypothetical protein
MISTIQGSEEALKRKHEKDFETCVFPAIKSTHEICADRATQYHSHYSILHKVIKWTKKWSCTQYLVPDLNLFRIFCNPKPQKLSCCVAKPWITPKPDVGRDEKAGPVEQPNEHLILTHLPDLVVT